MEAVKIKEWEDKFDEDQKIKTENEKIKEEKIRQKDRIRFSEKENDNLSSQDELFSKLENFSIDKSKKN